MAKLSSSLPKGHGLNVAVRRLAQGDPVVALVVLRRFTKTENFEKGETELTLKVSEVEAIHPDDLYLAKRLMERALEARTGQPVLPYDLETALEGVFEGLGLDYPKEPGRRQEALPIADEPVAQEPSYCTHCGKKIQYAQAEADGLWHWRSEDGYDCPDTAGGHEVK